MTADMRPGTTTGPDTDHDTARTTGETTMEMFGRYRLDSVLGRGGMGEVYRAYDTQRERTVALKRLQPGMAADGEYQERFRRESRLAARLSSPHVIPIHDFGEIDGRLFIDMRLVEGQDLAAEIARSGPLAPARAVEIVRQVAHALDAAHDDGLVHRDVKPSNVLLTTHRGVDFAYLVDFGIVRTTGDGDGDARSSLTATGSAIGTMTYMAPELFTAAPIDRRVDVYALACLLFETLTGGPPFTAEGPALMYQHLHTEPPRPTRTRPDLPAGFDEVIARGMAKEPAARYATTSELAEAAAAAMTGTRPAEVTSVADPGPSPTGFPPTTYGPGSEPTYIPGPGGSGSRPPSTPPASPYPYPPHVSDPNHAGYPHPPSDPRQNPYPVAGYAQAPVKKRRTGLLIVLTALGTVFALIVIFVVIAVLVDDGTTSGAASTGTPSATPAPAAQTVANTGDQLALLRRVYPGSSAPGQNCRPYQPGSGEFAPNVPQAVISCADQANGATLYYTLWADNAQATAYFERLRAGRTSVDGFARWAIDNVQQGGSYTGPVQSSTDSFVVTIYDGKRFSFTAQAPSVAAVDTTFGQTGFTPKADLPE